MSNGIEDRLAKIMYRASIIVGTIVLTALTGWGLAWFKKLDAMANQSGEVLGAMSQLKQEVQTNYVDKQEFTAIQGDIKAVNGKVDTIINLLQKEK